ncbi:MAG: AAA family ATPase [Schaedlerella arabinosiphila]|nr:AAA family ATPase [Schaedlerella arabinosiphila]
MGMFLNSRNCFEDYRETVSDTYFVDKSALIRELIPALEKKNRYFCITRPRRFGKSVMANMVGAFFGKAADSSGLFAGLQITKDKEGNDNQDYHKHLNRHNVIFIDFSEIPRDCTDYRQYIDRIQNGINNDLAQAYPDFEIHTEDAVWDILSDIFQKTGDKFIFVMDEWDALFHMPFITEEARRTYLLFLKALLKGKVYVELAYMTGVLPIAKYSSGSELNMFLEYDMVTKKKFGEYFGFQECRRTAAGKHLA